MLRSGVTCDEKRRLAIKKTCYALRKSSQAYLYSYKEIHLSALYRQEAYLIAFHYFWLHVAKSIGSLKRLK